MPACDCRWGDPQYVKKNAIGKVTGDIIIHHVKPRSEMAKIMNLKDVKGQPTVILLKVTDFFPFKAWKVLYATTENSKKTLSTPVWCPEAQAHLVGGKKKDVVEFHDMCALTPPCCDAAPSGLQHLADAAPILYTLPVTLPTCLACQVREGVLDVRPQGDHQVRCEVRQEPAQHF